MRLVHTLPLLALAALTLQGTTTANSTSSGGADCLAEGFTTTICWTIDLTAPGEVVGTTIVPGSVIGLEYDWGYDDQLGAGTLNGNEICIAITNNGGDLSGPNGVVQSGGSEGCLEVYLQYEVRWQVQRCSGYTPGFTIGATKNGNGGTIGTSGSGATRCWMEWEGENRTTSVMSVCACD